MKEFKVGDEVYDSVISPGIRGKVVDVDTSTYALTVEFEDDTVLSYTKEGRYYEDAVPTLSHTPYTVKIVEGHMTFEGFFKL